MVSAQMRVNVTLTGSQTDEANAIAAVLYSIHTQRSRTFFRRQSLIKQLYVAINIIQKKKNQTPLHDYK